MRARSSTLLVGILAMLPLAIVWFALVTSNSTLGEVQGDVARRAVRDASGEAASATAEYIQPVAETAVRSAEHLGTGVVDPFDAEAIDAYLRTTVVAQPRIVAMGWYHDDGRVHEIRRDDGTLISTRFDPGADEPIVVTTRTTLSGESVSETAVTGIVTVPDPILAAQARANGIALSGPAGGTGDATGTLTIAAGAAERPIATDDDGTPVSEDETTQGVDYGGALFVTIDLADLSSFLASYEPTATSRVFLVADGDLIAHSRPEVIGRAPAGIDVTELSDEITMVASGLALGGDGWQLLTIDEAPYHASSASIEALPDLGWTAVVVSPEDDFNPLFTTIRRDDSILLGLAGIIAIVLALPVARFAVRDVGTLRTAAHRDALTGLLNRRTFEKHGSALVTASRRRRRSVGALMVDIDHFKQLNDTYGHHAGDEILEAVAGRISHSVAKTDLVARLGGDELALLLEGADLAASRSVAHRLRNAVTATPISTNRGPIYVTISIGASATEGMERARLDDLLKAADRALYASKRAGRDRITAVQVARTH